MIPQSNPGAGYQAERIAIDAAVHRVLASGWYILGPEVVAFESEFAAYLGVRHALGVASGTDALELALRALGVTGGDRVLTVSHTAVATVAAIGRVAAEPVFLDIDPTTMTLDPEALDQWLAAGRLPLPPAVIVVHLYGQPAAMLDILSVARRYGVAVIEDCAQAHGAGIGERRVGTLGDIGCFSMYPTKNLGALGDAGAVVTNDDTLHERLTQLRQYGWKQRFISEIPGVNSRIDELQAAILRARLPRLDANNARRRLIAGAYDDALQDCALVLPLRKPGTMHVFHQYVVRSTQRGRLMAELARREIGCAIHYPAAVHQQPAYAAAARASPDLPRTEAAVAQVLSLPLYPELDLETVRGIGKTIAALAR